MAPGFIPKPQSDSQWLRAALPNPPHTQHSANTFCVVLLERPLEAEVTYCAFNTRRYVFFFFVP